ncbi:hypothetical protein POUND7_012743 [Theobroma cacao]
MQRNNNNGVAAAGVHPACAACKHQRKKCDENCILAPYFPADRSREFQAVHKVFGVSNATKIVRNANTQEDRKRVADSLIWEAFCRQKDPVLGPYGEYRKIYEELTLYKSQNQMMLLQVQGRGDEAAAAAAAAFKMPPAVAEWNNNSNKRIDVKGAFNNAALRYDHGDSLVHFTTYGYPSQSDKPAVQEKGIHNATTLVPLQYYASDVGHINGKALESTRWDNIL